jgi:competence protein ComEC
MRLLIAFSVLLALAGFVRVFIFLTTPEYRVGEQVSKTVTLFEDPTISKGKQSVYLGSLRVLLPLVPRLQYGDTVKIAGQTAEESFVSSSGTKVVSLVLDQAKFTKLDSPIYIRVAAWIRSRITGVVERRLPPNEATLLLGITLGIKHGFDRDFYSQLKQSGVLHIVAASGSNVSLLAAFLLPIFQYLMKRRLALIATGTSIIFYALLSGFDPSIMRATFMALVSFTALVLGRQNTAVFTLFLVSAGMVLFDPSLIVNVGFQLSVSATLGILLIKSKLDRLKLLKDMPFVKEDLNTTLSAQWGSLPILISQFGSFSPLSVVVNVLVLWMVPILMVLGLIISLAAISLPVLATPVIYLSYPLLKLFVIIISFTAPYSFIVQVPALSQIFTISYYLLSLSIIVALSANSPQKREKRKQHEHNIST